MSLYDSLVKLAYEKPQFRDDLMPILSECGKDHEGFREEEARFEKGKPADPTENMSPEDAEKWEEMKEEHGDKFKDKESARVRLTDKVASSFFKEMVDYRAMMKFRGEVKKHDKQSADLLNEILLHFHKLFKMEQNVEAAFNRLNNMVSRGMTSPDMVGNQIAKIADLLGISARHF